MLMLLLHDSDNIFNLFKSAADWSLLVWMILRGYSVPLMKLEHKDLSFVIFYIDFNLLICLF